MTKQFIQALKKDVKQLKRSNRRVVRLGFLVLQKLWYAAQILTDGRFRSETVARYRFKGHYYQRSTYTTLNRYPILFEHCTAYFSKQMDVKILSFGCSTGEEVRSLGEYIPYAIILGVDINEWCLGQCRKRDTHTQHHYCHLLSSEFALAEGFDAIFCMAVFQRTENRNRADNAVARGFVFNEFERNIGVLDGKLKIGGLFVMDHADFSFEDTIYAHRYRPLQFEGNRVVNHRPQFGTDNLKTGNEQFNYRVFVKVS